MSIYKILYIYIYIYIYELLMYINTCIYKHIYISNFPKSFIHKAHFQFNHVNFFFQM